MEKCAQKEFDRADIVRDALKKSLTELTLLEMSGNATTHPVNIVRSAATSQNGTSGQRGETAFVRIGPTGSNGIFPEGSGELSVQTALCARFIKSEGTGIQAAKSAPPPMPP